MLKDTSYEVGLTNLRNIVEEFHQFCKVNSKITEADTRRILIDRIIQNVLFWNNSFIKCEKHVSADKALYFDYIYTYRDNESVVIEAKKVDIYFDLPNIKTSHIKIQNLMKNKDSKLTEAIEQAWNYCANNGSSYGIVTNGNIWIIFKAIAAHSVKWREGYAYIFSSLLDIITDFDMFWNLLSADNLENYSLQTKFPSSMQSERENFNKRLIEDFNFNKDLFEGRFFDRIKKYHDIELPVAKAIFTKTGYSEDENKYYFTGNTNKWLQVKPGVVQFNCNLMFIQADKDLAGNIFEDKENYEITATLNYCDDLISFKNFKLKHTYKEIYFDIIGITDIFPTKSFNLELHQCFDMILNSELKQLYIINSNNEFLVYSLDFNLLQKHSLLLKNKETIIDAFISNNGTYIFTIINNTKGEVVFQIFKRNDLGFSLINSDRKLNACIETYISFEFINNETALLLLEKELILINLEYPSCKSIKTTKIKTFFSFEKYLQVFFNKDDNILALMSNKTIYLLDFENHKIIDSISHPYRSQIIFLCSQYLIVYVDNFNIYERICKLTFKDHNLIKEFCYSTIPLIYTNKVLNNNPFTVIACTRYISDIMTLEIINTACKDMSVSLIVNVDNIDYIPLISYYDEDSLLILNNHNSIRIWKLFI